MRWRQRRLRSWWRHEQQSIAATPPPPVTTALVRLLWKKWDREEEGTNDAPRGQRPPPAGMWPVQLADAPGPPARVEHMACPCSGVPPREAVVSEPAHDDATIAFLLAHSLAA